MQHAMIDSLFANIYIYRQTDGHTRTHTHTYMYTDTHSLPFLIHTLSLTASQSTDLNLQMIIHTHTHLHPLPLSSSLPSTKHQFQLLLQSYGTTWLPTPTHTRMHPHTFYTFSPSLFTHAQLRTLTMSAAFASCLKIRLGICG